MSVALVAQVNAWQAAAIAGIRKYHFPTYHRDHVIFGTPDESYVLYMFFRFDPRSGMRPISFGFRAGVRQANETSYVREYQGIDFGWGVVNLWILFSCVKIVFRACNPSSTICTGPLHITGLLLRPGLFCPCLAMAKSIRSPV